MCVGRGGGGMKNNAQVSATAIWLITYSINIAFKLIKAILTYLLV